LKNQKLNKTIKIKVIKLKIKRLKLKNNYKNKITIKFSNYKTLKLTQDQNLKQVLTFPAHLENEIIYIYQVKKTFDHVFQPSPFVGLRYDDSMVMLLGLACRASPFSL